jgi:hypothetical protein
MKKVLLSFACLLLGHQMYASHVQGAQIKYEFNGSNYIIYLEEYRACGGGLPLPSTVQVDISSVSLGASFSVTAPLVHTDTVDYSCPYNTNSCVVPSSTEPGKEIGMYASSVSLVPANDWVISYTESARAFTNNLPSDYLYIEATLDNSNGVNTSPVWPIMENYYLENGTAFSYPMQLTDVDGDSLDVQFVNPKNGYNTTVVPFVGHTLISPFGIGSSCSINNTTKTIDMTSTVPGITTLALKVREYRSGVLIGSYMRDYIVATTSAPAPHDIFTFPAPASGSVFESTICAGQSGSMTVNFGDISTDSVYVDMTAPSSSGWTFTASTSNGLGIGVATISYTAPVTMSPSAYPILIPVHVKDNACPEAAIEYTFIIRPTTCHVDSVWPGDANSDNIVNLYDPLYVALAYSQTGPARPGATTSWTGQYCSDWATHFPLSGVNHKHADCNGDGVVNVSDLSPIISNYGLMHTRPGHRTSAGAPLKFDLTGIQFIPGTTVSVPIILGDAMNSVNLLFGMATRISVSGIRLTTPVISYNYVTWMGASNELFNFNKNIGNNIVDWVQAHTDGNYNNGHGEVGTLQFTIPADAEVGSEVTLSFSSTLLINIDGLDIPDFTEEQAVATIQWPTNVADVNGKLQNASVIPNPSYGNANVVFTMQNKGNVSVEVTDITGKHVWHHEGEYNNGKQAISLPSGDLGTGLYLIKVSSDDQKIAQQLKWNKQ